jgi:glutaredoxin
MTRRFAVLAFVALLAMLVATGACRRWSSSASGDPLAAAPFVVKPDSEGFLLTWIDDKGDFHVEMKVADVPLMGRDTVRVVDPNREEGTHGDSIFVADLRTLLPDGTYPVHVMKRADFEALAVARREKSGPTLASAAPSTPPAEPMAQGAPLPVQPPSNRPAVIIYGADWCGPCHEAAAYLRKKGIAYVEKNVDTDGEAQREMAAKLAKAGLRGGSIPVLDVRGRVMVGFNPRAVDEALGQAL